MGNGVFCFNDERQEYVSRPVANARTNGTVA
jgi:hypothetical protein